MDWDKLKTFHAAAEAGSLTGAAEQLGLSQSAVSRQIAALEDQLGVTLFHRHPRGLAPTEPGRILLDTTQDIAARVTLAEATLRDARDKPSGELTVTAPIALGTTWLAPRLRPFREAYPDIALHLVLDDGEADLSSFEVEAAIQLRRPTRADLVQKRLMTVRQSLYASPDYLARRKPPRSPEELDDHPLILYGAADSGPMKGVDWARDLGRSGQPRQAALTVNTIHGVKAAVEAGLGIGGLPEYLARGSQRLAPVLPEHHGPPFEVYFAYAEELRASRRIEAFRDFLVSEARRFER